MFYNKGFYQFEIFLPHRAKVSHGLSNRHGGVSMGEFATLNLGIGLRDNPSAVEKNYQIFLSPLGIDYKKISHAFQRHTDEIAIIDSPLGYQNPLDATDAFITNMKKAPLLVRFADCQGILLYDPENSAIGAIHAGWRGNANNIIGKTIRKMKAEFGSDPSKILAGVSPSLGPCCADFTDPLSELPEEMHRFINVENDENKKKVDLWACAKHQLLAEGLSDSHIDIAQVCTVCNKDEFFSYRGDKKRTGHMAGVIELL